MLCRNGVFFVLCVVRTLREVLTCLFLVGDGVCFTRATFIQGWGRRLQRPTTALT
jgi:hypothetical protein